MNDPKRMLIRNIFSNWMGMFVGLIVTFFLSPFLVHTLGKSAYGIWALVFSIIYYTNLLDSGMKQSLARYIPKYYAVKDYGKLNEVINSGTLVYAFAGSLVILMTLVIAFWFIAAFNVEPEMITAMRITLIIIGLDQAITFFVMAATAIGLFHRYDVNNIIGIPFTIISALTTVFFLKRGYGLVCLAIITISGTLVRSAIKRIYQQHLVPQIRFHIKYIKKERIRELLSYGVVSFFIVVSWMIVFNTDNIIIGVFLSTTAITYYSIAGSLIGHLRGLMNALGIPLVPTVSHFDAQNDSEEITVLFTKVPEYLYYFSSAICFLILIFGDNFIYQWMGPDFTMTVKILYILIIPACVYLPQIAFNSVLLGIGKHKTLFHISITEAVMNLILSLALVKPLGVIGVALGTAISQISIYTYFFPVIFHKIVKGDLRSFYKYTVKAITTCAAAAVPLGLIIDKYNPLEGWAGLILGLSSTGAVILWVFWRWILYPEDKSRILAKFMKRK